MNNSTHSVKLKECIGCKKEFPHSFEYFYKIKGKPGTRCKTCTIQKNNESRKKKMERTQEFNEKVWASGKVTKQCYTCKKELPATLYYFYKNSSGKYGLLASCKVCKGAKYEENFLYHEDGYKKCRSCRKTFPCTSEYFHRQGNIFRGKCKQCQRKHRGYLYRKDPSNREKNKINNKKRESLKKELVSNYKLEDWIKCKNHFNNSCAYCGKKNAKLHQEHFIPIYRNGEYSKTNIIPACESCNCSKRATDFFVWYPQQSFYSYKREKKILKYLNYDKNMQQQLALL